LPAIAGGLLLALAPVLTLVFAAGGSASGGAGNLLAGGFGSALLRSLAVAGAVAAGSLLAGLPAGLLAALYDFPFRRALLLALALPLLLPSFLCAIGFSLLRTSLGLPADGLLSGFTGTVITFTTFAWPLVIFITIAAVRGISRSQVDAARLAGGERHLLAHVARAVLPVAALTALLAGVLTLSDPGPGQILGWSGAASEILVSFASQYDFALAARQCLALAGVVLVVAMPVTLLLAPRLAAGLLARDVNPAPPARVRAATVCGPLVLSGLFALTTLLPLAGFVEPLFRDFPLRRALAEALRTLPSTLFYGVGAAVMATAFGVALALAAGRVAAGRGALVAGLLVLLALPPSLGALGFVHLAGASPAALDPLLRSEFTVALSLALRLTAIAAIFAMRSFGSTSPSWANAAAVHGVPLRVYLRAVLAPWMAVAMVPAGLLVGLLAVADVSTVLLLHPPGRASLPLGIFTVMANAPESIVGAMCLAYVAGAAALLGAGGWLAGRMARFASREARP
jgi:iron(III) transport system permease protein